jgi:uncharacterized membrane protein
MNVQRFEQVDVLRGLAMVWMTVFHFYSDPVWTWQRTCILSLFLLCAGAGQGIAVQQGQSWPRFWRRWLQIAACAMLVTAGSALMFPNSYIYFGVLHGMAVMLVIVRLSAGWGAWLWPMGALAIATKFIAAYAISAGVLGVFLNEKMFNWLGLISVKPITEDYVPLLPWLGVMWWGMAAARWWMARSVNLPTGARWSAPGLRSVAVLGRWSLSYYMLHQPILLGGLWLWAMLTR